MHESRKKCSAIGAASRSAIHEPGYICTNFNNSPLPSDAVRSLAASAAKRYELYIIVVDNQSTPKNRKALKQLAGEFACVDLLLNEENVSYFPGLNCGIHRMRERCPVVGYIVIGNNDLVFPPDFCTKVEAQSHLFDAYPVVSPDIVTLFSERQNPHVIKSMSKSREIVYDLHYSSYLLAQVTIWAARVSKSMTDRLDERQRHMAQPICQGHGSCYLIGPKFFQHFQCVLGAHLFDGRGLFLQQTVV